VRYNPLKTFCSHSHEDKTKVLLQFVLHGYTDDMFNKPKIFNGFYCRLVSKEHLIKNRREDTFGSFLPYFFSRSYKFTSSYRLQEVLQGYGGKFISYILTKNETGKLNSIMAKY
jgi:hypothetical protein